MNSKKNNKKEVKTSRQKIRIDIIRLFLFFIMKTIQELNSKWYWRLIKVAYIWVFIISVLASIWGIYFSILKYNPDNIEAVEKKISSESSFRDNMLSYDKKIEEDFWSFISIDEFKSHSWFFMWSDTATKLKNVKILLALWYNIDFVSIGLTDSDNDGYDKWLLNDNWSLFINRNDVDSWKTYISSSERFISNSWDELNDAKNNGYSYFSDYPISNDYDETLGDKEYLGFIWLIKLIVLSILGILANLLWFYIIRWIVYYIILWKFNPEK